MLDHARQRKSRYALIQVMAAAAIACAVALLTPMEPTRGAVQVEVERHNTYLSDMAPDLITANVFWPYSLGAELCESGRVDYDVVVQGPHVDAITTTKAWISVFVRHEDVGEGVGEKQHIFVGCQFCPAKTMNVGAYDPADWVQLNYDSTNQRWGIYVGSQGGWVRTITESDGKLARASYLEVGAETYDANNELGPFKHGDIKLRKNSNPNWDTFQPVDHGVPDQEHEPNGRFRTTYINGSVGVLTQGGATCP